MSSSTASDDEIPLLNPLDPVTWAATQTLQTGAIKRTKKGNVPIQPVFLVNPSTNPIVATGVLGAVTVSGTVNVDVTSGGVTVDNGTGTAQQGVSAITNDVPPAAGAAFVQSRPVYSPSKVASIGGTSVSGAPLTLITAGSGQSLRIFSITVVGTIIGLNAATFTINDGSGGSIFFTYINTNTNTAGSMFTATIDCGPVGILTIPGNWLTLTNTVSTANVEWSVTVLYSGPAAAP